ncbi:B12-binding domain-containing radical SAM protein [Streptomyces hydrogenans]|uniref:B12-binding domain-containing radical SAM protein n=1 Tax=Streptomyces hydrogenans TaxID=1873719 RepID=UPI003687D22D
MSLLQQETDRIRASEIFLADPYEPKDPAGRLRVVLAMPYGHAYSLMCSGPMALYDLINRDPVIPAVAERAVEYDCLVRDGARLRPPAGETYRSIESAAPVSAADVLGVSVTNAGGLHQVLRLLDLAKIPRRAADRVPGRHPLVVGGGPGLANPEPLADYLDAIALGEAEQSVPELLRVLHAHRLAPGPVPLHRQLARVPGLYVPSAYRCETVPGGGVRSVLPVVLGVPGRVHAPYLSVAELPAAHFCSPVSDGTAAVISPVLGCLHDCHFCTLGVPDFRQAPLGLLTGYVDRLEARGIRTIVISAPTFTQYRHKRALLEHIRAYADRAAAKGEKVATIIGSVRADEITADYLKAVTELGDFGHLFTELSLDRARGVVTIAPEFADDDLVALYGKTLKRERVKRAVDLCRDSGRVNVIMLYFIVGAPGETAADRDAVADYAREVRERLGHEDAVVIVKLTQFQPTPGTLGQRLAMADPDTVQAHGRQIAARLRTLAGAEYERHYRVELPAPARMRLEAVCLRGDRRVGRVLEDLYDAGTDLAAVTRDQLADALAVHGLDFDRHLRHMDDPVLPWQVVDAVNPAAERQLAAALTEREARP